MNREDLLDVKDRHLKAARALATKAQAEGRNFTDDERANASGHLRKAREAAEKIGDEAILDQLNALGRPAEGTKGRRGPRDGSWAKAMRDHLATFSPSGQKGVTVNGSISVPSLSTGIVELGDRPRSVLNLIPFEDLTTDAFSYLREVTREHNASTVATGKKKPESNYATEMVEDRARTIAHTTIVDKKYLDDAALMQQYLEGAMRDGAELALEDQVLNGDGDTTGDLDDMTGILATSGTQAQPWVTDRFTTARKAVTKLENVPGLDPSGFAWVLSPAEWEAYELAEDAEHYVLGGPGAGGVIAPPIDRASRRLWGYPVVVTPAKSDGESLLGDFKGSVKIREREGVTLAWSIAGFVKDLYGEGLDGDLMDANKVKVRAEGRWGLEVSRARAFVVVDLTA